MGEKRREEQPEIEQEIMLEELVRKTSKVVLHAAEKGRTRLFDVLTYKNIEKINRILDKKPIFYENEQHAKTEILLSPELGETMPAEFFENPTQWIESQNNIERHYGDKSLPTGKNIKEMRYQSYDISKVKEFSVTDEHGKYIKIVSKRIKPEETSEIALAVKAFAAGIPTPKVLGEIYDKGNTYAFFEKIDGIDLKAALKKKKLDHYSLAFGVTDMDEEWFWKDFTNLPFKNFISDVCRQEIFNNWKKAKKDFILEREISIPLKDLFRDVSERYFDQVEDKMESLRWKNTLNKEAIDKILKKYGFKNLDDLENQKLEGADLEKYKKLLKIINRRAEILSKKSTIFKDNLSAAILKDILGVDVNVEKEKLEKMCKEKGIEHKDFADRNILVGWDFEKDEPKGKDSGDVKLYVIDWEKKSKSNKK